MPSRLPVLRATLLELLNERPVNMQAAHEIQERIVQTIAQETHAMRLIEAAKQLTDGPYPCLCDGSGYVFAGQAPVFADGGYSDVEDIYERCPVCNRPATDEDYELAVACGLLDEPADDDATEIDLALAA